MTPLELIESVAKVGFPVACAGLMLWVWVSDRKRSNAREDMLLRTAIHGREGDGNGTKAIPGIREIVATEVKAGINGQISGAIEPLVSEQRAMRGELRAYREQAAWADTRATQALQIVYALPCVDDNTEQDCPRDAATAS